MAHSILICQEHGYIYENYGNVGPCSEREFCTWGPVLSVMVEGWVVGFIHLPFGGLIDSVGLDTPSTLPTGTVRLGLVSPRPFKGDSFLAGNESLFD
jgi:hypothetical protein